MTDNLKKRKRTPLVDVYMMIQTVDNRYTATTQRISEGVRV